MSDLEVPAKPTADQHRASLVKRDVERAFRPAAEEPLSFSFADNGREAVDIFCSESPDIVLMDISMPEMDGCETARTSGTSSLPKGARPAQSPR